MRSRPLRKLASTFGIHSRQEARDRLSSLGAQRPALGRVVGVSPDSLFTHWYSDTPNLGDALTPVLVEHVTGRPVRQVGRTYEGKLLAVGSVLDDMAPRDVIWGSGAIRDRPLPVPAGVEVLAVRGPLTAALLQTDVPEIYGDPALLLPRYFTPRPTRRWDIGIVPHYVDHADVRAAVTDPAVALIDVTAPWRDVVTQIVSCDVVLSSSLHGLVIAEAYGLPAVWIEVSSDRIHGGWFKYHDYLLSTHREPRRPLAFAATSLTRAVAHVLPPGELDAGAVALAAKPLSRTSHSTRADR